MEQYCLIQALVAQIEATVRSESALESCAAAMALSYPHLRDVFRSQTGVTLGRYERERRLAHAAFDLAHGEGSVLDIALQYGFGSPDGFTRAFKRLYGLTPSEFRQRRIEVGRVRLGTSVFGPGFRQHNAMLAASMETTMSSITQSSDSCILYGVPKVAYTYEECTPFPTSLKAVLNYMGQKVDYAYLMAASGAAFRLRWNTAEWDGGNVDIMNIWPRPEEALERALRAAGREWTFLSRGKTTTKTDCIEFVRAELDAGRPLIAFGIIGPPEACVVAGYRDGGATLLGWNVFQSNPEFAGGIEFEENGYFRTSLWWENKETILFLAIGERRNNLLPWQDLVRDALTVLETPRCGAYAGGQAAYQAWADALSDDSQFDAELPLPRLYERLMCQNDALVMVGEGRAYAAKYLRTLLGQFESGEAERAGEACAAALREAAECFEREFELSQQMWKLQDGVPGSDAARRLCDPALRRSLRELVLACKKADAQAAAAMRRALELARG